MEDTVEAQTRFAEKTSSLTHAYFTRLAEMVAQVDVHSDEDVAFTAKSALAFWRFSGRGLATVTGMTLRDVGRLANGIEPKAWDEGHRRKLLKHIVEDLQHRAAYAIPAKK